MNRRTAVLAAIVAFGTLSIVVSARQATPQGPTAASLKATTIEKVKDNLYVITGSSISDMDEFSGGNTAVLVTDKGVVLVDTKLPGWGKPILDRIKTVTDKPITTIINTHTHDDHTGSNDFFGASVETIVHENTRTNMMRMDAFKGEKAKFLPKRTYKDKLSLGSGKDQIDLYYLGVGHTNGDTFVVFPALRVMHAGDMFAWKALPYIDTSNGGSVVSHAETLRKAVSTIQERRHRHHRPYTGADVERAERIRRFQSRFRLVGPGTDKSRESGRRRRGCVPSAREVQGLQRLAQSSARRREGER